MQMSERTRRYIDGNAPIIRRYRIWTWVWLAFGLIFMLIVFLTDKYLFLIPQFGCLLLLRQIRKRITKMAVTTVEMLREDNNI